eukprot:340479-Prorocentrum_minimum.AAC.2
MATKGRVPVDNQSDAGHTGIFSRRTNRTQTTRVYSHDGPIGRRPRRYILTTDQSDADHKRPPPLPTDQVRGKISVRKGKHPDFDAGVRA